MTRAAGPSSILVITQDPATRESATQILIEEGYSVEAAATCAKALERVRKHQLAAILIDLTHVGEACCAFVASCRQEFNCQGTPILVMAPTPRAALGAIRHGAQGYVKLPVAKANIMPMLSQVHL